jgi:hypothetical protein
MADYQPVRANGTNPYTAIADADIAAGQLLFPTANGNVSPTTTAGIAKACGVAAFDAKDTMRVSVWPLDGVEHEVACPGGASAGDGIIGGDAGIIAKAAPTGGPPTDYANAAAAGQLIGICTVGCAADAGQNTGHKARFIGRG